MTCLLEKFGNTIDTYSKILDNISEDLNSTLVTKDNLKQYMELRAEVNMQYATFIDLAVKSSKNPCGSCDKQKCPYRLINITN
jgi:hypothetical protein